MTRSMIFRMTQGPDEGEDDADRAGEELDEELPRIAVQDAGMAAAEAFQMAGSAKTPVQSAPDEAADAVAAEGVERVVVAELLLHEGDHDEADDAGEAAPMRGPRRRSRSRRPA